MLLHNHLVKNVSLVILSLLFLPADTFVVGLSWMITRLFGSKAVSRRRKAQSRPGFKPKKIVITGVGMSKGLFIARAFFEAGHTVIGADVEPNGSLVCGRASRSVTAFVRLPDPSSRGGAESYIDALVNLIVNEKIDLWISCSGVANAVIDGRVQEAARRKSKCATIQFDTGTTGKLHDKDSFMNYLSSIDLKIPDTYTVRSHYEVKTILEKAPEEFRYIMKPNGMDDANRGNMTLLPLPTQTGTHHYIDNLNISKGSTWILQQFIDGSEYCTHSIVVRGQIKAFVACPSEELLMHYQALPESSRLYQAMLEFTEKVASKHGEDFAGHLSFDFMFQDGSDIPYPIECNPRCHTADILFRGREAAMVEAYLTSLDGQSSTTSADGIVHGTSRRKYYWIGHDVVALLIVPIVSFLTVNLGLRPFIQNISDFVRHVVLWRDATFELWDPLPWWWLYHVYWPMQFIASLRNGQKWSRINVSTGKMFLL